MSSVDVWPMHNWDNLKIALEQSSLDAVDPQDYLVAMDAGISDSTTILFRLKENFRKIARKSPPDLAELVQQVFLTPFAEGLDDLSIKNSGYLDSRNWCFVGGSLSPTTASRLYQLSLQIDNKEVKQYFQSSEDTDEDFEFFWEDASQWLQVLEEANAEGYGLLICYF